MKSKELKIVIADDNKEMCELITDILGDSGYKVDAVYDGYELLTYLETNVPAVIILDLMMPEKDGITIFDTIKQISPYSKIIIYTGHQEYEHSIYARNADRFVVKGQSIKELVDAVDELA
ncbi:MAG: response regulator [Candidatus Omnitrophica bacterium]|nr:response regulator [Candidatus Omnitrophota bacterium]